MELSIFNDQKRGHPLDIMGFGTLRLICEMSEPKELCNLMVASRCFHRPASDEKIWIRHIIKDFPLISREQLAWRLNTKSAKEFYIEMASAEIQNAKYDADSDVKEITECPISRVFWDSFHRFMIPVMVPLLLLTITALIIARLEHQQEHSKTVQRGVEASNVRTLVGNIDHTWVALTWWLLLPIMGTAALSIWYFRVWNREIYNDLVGPFKAFTSKVLNDSVPEMHMICPSFLFLLAGIGFFSLRVSGLVISFSYWWVTFPLMIMPTFLLGWAYHIALPGNLFDILLAIGTTLFITFPLFAFVTLLTLFLDGEHTITAAQIAAPLFITEGMFFFLICTLSCTDRKRTQIYIFTISCIGIPLMIFQILVILRNNNHWSYGAVFAPCLVGEVALLIFGCLFTTRELKMIPEEILQCLDEEDDDFLEP